MADLPGLVRPGDVLVVNTTRVLPARLRLRKATGGAVEVLLLDETATGAWEALVRPGRRVRPGTVLVAGPDLTVPVGGDGAGDGTRLVDLVGADGRRVWPRSTATASSPCRPTSPPPSTTRALPDGVRRPAGLGGRPHRGPAPHAGGARRAAGRPGPGSRRSSWWWAWARSAR